MDEFEMQLIEFQSSSIWKQKFIDLRVDLQNIEKKQLEKGILERSAENELLRAWNAIPENFSCLKTLKQHYSPSFHLHMLCKFLLSVMNFSKSHNSSSLTDDTSSSYISLKVTKYKPNVNLCQQ